MLRRITLKNRLSEFASDKRGNFVLIFALLLLPMLGLLGLAVDFSLALRTKTALDAGTDAAVLAAATEAEQIIQQYSTPNYDATPTAIAAGTIAGQQVFNANTAMLHTVTKPVITLTLQRQGQVINATGNYTAQSPTMFGNMFGTNALNAAGKAASSLTLPKYLNFYIVVDISQSMGIAATQDYMDQLSTLTGGCVFGCHVPQGSQTQSNETVAHNANIQLRIDVVRQSIKNIVASAQSKSNGKPTIKIGIYTMQHDISTVSALSTDYATLQTSADSIDLGPNDSSGVGDSDMTTSLTNFASQLSASGDGSSANSAQNFVFLMTDGVYDVYGSNCTYGHCTAVFDPGLCDPFKSKSATVGVIYTTYTPFPNEQTYVSLVQSFASGIAPHLQSCASAGYYFEAEDGPAIQDAAQALFAQATASGRLTQ